MKPPLQTIKRLVDGIAVLNGLGFSLVLFAVASPSVVISRSGLVWMSIYAALSWISMVMVRSLPLRILSLACGIYYLWAINQSWLNNSSVPPAGSSASDMVLLSLLVLLLLIQCLLRLASRKRSMEQHSLPDL